MGVDKSYGSGKPRSAANSAARRLKNNNPLRTLNSLGAVARGAAEFVLPAPMRTVAKMVNSKKMKKMGDDLFDPAGAVGDAAKAVGDFVAKRAYIVGKEFEDVMSGNYYKRRSPNLNRLDSSGASLQTLKTYGEGKYNKKNKGGR